MSAIGHAWDRLRLRHAPPQVREAYWLWREVRAEEFRRGYEGFQDVVARDDLITPLGEK